MSERPELTSELKSKDFLLMWLFKNGSKKMPEKHMVTHLAMP